MFCFALRVRRRARPRETGRGGSECFLPFPQGKTLPGNVSCAWLWTWRPCPRLPPRGLKAVVMRRGSCWWARWRAILSFPFTASCDASITCTQSTCTHPHNATHTTHHTAHPAPAPHASTSSCCCSAHASSQVGWSGAGPSEAGTSRRPRATPLLIPRPHTPHYAFYGRATGQGHGQPA
jgi:hypothetical protein